MTNSSSSEPVDLSNPAIEPLQLHELAQTHPHLWDEILQHPNVYPGLAQWIHDRQAEQSGHDPADVSADAAATEEFSRAELEADASDQDAEQPRPDEDQPTSWIDAAFERPSEETPATAEPTQSFDWGQPQASPQPSQGFPQFGQEPTQHSGFAQHQPQQPLYGQPQQYMMPRQTASKIDLQSRRTWGVFIAGGAAFLALFGFFFSPAASPTSMASPTHFGSGGWLLLILLIATVAVSVIDLIAPSRWTRYFFTVLGIGTAFALLGRYMTIAGLLTGYGVGFSLVWLIFMAIVLLAGTMVYLAPDMASSAPQQQSYHASPNQPGPQFPQHGGFGRYPQQPGQPGGSHPFGGNYPPHTPGSPR